MRPLLSLTRVRQVESLRNELEAAEVDRILAQAKPLCNLLAPMSCVLHGTVVSCIDVMVLHHGRSRLACAMLTGGVAKHDGDRHGVLEARGALRQRLIFVVSHCWRCGWPHAIQLRWLWIVSHLVLHLGASASRISWLLQRR